MASLGSSLTIFRFSFLLCILEVRLRHRRSLTLTFFFTVFLCPFSTRIVTDWGFLGYLASPSPLDMVSGMTCDPLDSSFPQRFPSPGISPGYSSTQHLPSILAHNDILSTLQVSSAQHFPLTLMCPSCYSRCITRDKLQSLGHWSFPPSLVFLSPSL